MDQGGCGPSLRPSEIDSAKLASTQSRRRAHGLVLPTFLSASHFPTALQ